MTALIKLADLSGLPRPLLLAVAGVLVLCFALYKLATRTVNAPRIKGIPEIPGAVPFAGHLLLLGGRSGRSDTSVWTEWQQKYGWDVFQMRFGQERIVVANSYEAIKEIWTSQNSAAVISRPIPYTLARHVGLEMGAMAWDDVCKRHRGAAIKAVAPGTWKHFYPGLDRDSRSVVENIRTQGEQGRKAIELRQFLSLVAMNMGFLLTYGKTVDDLGGMSFVHGFINAAAKITEVRVGSSNWVDYIPFLRIFPSRNVAQAIEGLHERQPYLDQLYDAMKDDVEKGKATNCIGASLLSDKGSKLTIDDIKATCISMLQGSSETIAGTLTCGIGSLCASERGRTLQDDVYAAILARWGTPQEAFDHAFEAEDIPLVVALYKEMLRYYCIVTYALPRMAVRDIQLKTGGGGAVIPKGTTLLMNAEGGSHDPAFYGADADQFNPYRFMKASDGADTPLSATTLPHFAYGAGARICPAMQISNRILYALIIRMIVSFRFEASAEMPPTDHPVLYNEAYASLVARPKSYLAFCIPRE